MEQAPNALTKGSVVKALVTFTLPFCWPMCSSPSMGRWTSLW